ncbi:MAG: hypothetical protein AAGA20_19360 [Planctomycetota bacterium]
MNTTLALTVTLGLALGVDLFAQSGSVPPTPPPPGERKDDSVGDPLSPGAPSVTPGGGVPRPGDRPPNTGRTIPVETPLAPSGADEVLGDWSYWWYFECARYFDLRTRVQGPVAPDGRTILETSPLAPSREVIAERVLPRMVLLAQAAPEPEVVASALVAVGRLTEPDSEAAASSLDVLRGRLDDDLAEIRDAALLGLGLLGAPAGARDLAEIVVETERGEKLAGASPIPRRTRALAAHALGLAALRIDDVAERQRIALALVETLESAGRAGVDLSVAAVSALGHVDLGERSNLPGEELRAHELLRHVLSGRSLARYVATWLDGPPAGETDDATTFRVHALVAYARVARSASEASRGEAVERLAGIARSDEESETVRTAATLALGEVAAAGPEPADRGARATLIASLRSRSPLERRFAGIALASAAAEPAPGQGQGQGQGQGRPDGWARARSALTETLDGASGSDIAWTAIALGALEDGLRTNGVETDTALIDALSKALATRGRDDASAALGIGLALAARGTGRAEAAAALLVRELEKTADPSARGHLLVALGLLESRAAKEIVAAELAPVDAPPLLAWSAAIALGLLGESAEDLLVGRLRAEAFRDRRAALAAALGQTGTARTVEPLNEMVVDSERPGPLRAQAIDALAAICDRERYPWRLSIVHALPYFSTTPTLSGGGAGLIERAW